MNFNEKVVLITGAAGGIGSACAEKFAALGAKVAVVDCDKQGAENVAAAIAEKGFAAKAFIADVTDFPSVQACVRSVAEEWGGIDILVNVAGGSARKNRALFWEQNVSVFRHVMEINLFGTFYFAKECAPYMIEKKWGRIINISSIVGLNGHIKHSEYSAAKGGIITMTRSMAKEIGQYGVTVNTVCPGIIPTSNTGSQNDLGYSNFLNMTPSTSDIVGATLYLASDEARFVTGIELSVDGGRHLAMRGTE